MNEELRLTALERFVCIADRCPDTCCHGGWDIRVDPATFMRWQQLTPESARKRLLGSIEAITRSGVETMRLKRDPGGACMHFTEAGLCGVQLAYGAEMLPEVCRTYPRLFSQAADHTVHSATLSCPEIARLVLFDHGGLGMFTRQAHPGPVTDPIGSYLGALTEKVLDEQKYPLNLKLLYLGKVLTDLALRSQAGTLDETHLRKMERVFKQDLFELNIALKNGGLRPHPVVSGGFWRGAYRFAATRKLFADVADSVLANVLGHVEGDRERSLWAATGTEANMDISGNVNDVPDARYITIHEEISKHRSAARPHLEAFRPAFENYLRVAFVNRGFPWNPVAGNYIATFMAVVIPFAVVQMLLWIKAVERQGVSRADVEYAVYKTARQLSHSTAIYDMFNQYPELLRIDRYLECLAELY